MRLRDLNPDDFDKLDATRVLQDVLLELDGSLAQVVDLLDIVVIVGDLEVLPVHVHNLGVGVARVLGDLGRLGVRSKQVILLEGDLKVVLHARIDRDHLGSGALALDVHLLPRGLVPSDRPPTQVPLVHAADILDDLVPRHFERGGIGLAGLDHGRAQVPLPFGVSGFAVGVSAIDKERCQEQQGP